MRQLYDRRRQEVRDQVQAALKKSGLELNEDQKKRFVERYRDERRKLEEQLRQEMDAARQERMPALIERIEQEIKAENDSSTPTPSPSATPAAVETPAGAV